MMCRLLTPTESVDSVFKIDYERLWASGKRALLFDLDNTLGAGRPQELDPRVVDLLGGLEKRGFHIGILSNRRHLEKANGFAQMTKRFAIVHRAGKPSPRKYHRMIRMLGAQTDEAVMIGDRRLTDVLGANRAGIDSVLLRGKDPLARPQGQ